MPDPQLPSPPTWKDKVLRPPTETILEEAARIVDGDRMEVYGHPFDDFSTTASYWRTYLFHKHGVDVELQPEDVGWMMALLKISREGNMPKRDNKVDACGYIRTVEKVEEERERRS